jgi:hypothetical protein
MLRDIIVEVAAAQTDIEIVGEGADESAIANAGGAIDVLILAGRSAAEPSRCTEYLYHQPRMKILAIVDEGRRAFLFELRPFRVSLGELSPVSLLAAIREAGPHISSPEANP